MKKIIFGLSIVIIIIIIGILFISKGGNLDLKNEKIEQKNTFFDLEYNPDGNRINLDDTSEIFLEYSYSEDQNSDQSFRYTWFEEKFESLEIINELKNTDEKTVVILPIFTHSAYAEFGFYRYFEEKCSQECLTIEINRIQPPQYNSGKNAIQILHILNYNFISDIDIDSNPEILSNYDKVIVLHNEYVTKIEFDAITNHPNVLYLYPNALYAEINYDLKKDLISLIKGHGYPEKEINNGFDWEFENTHPFEYDTKCENWKFYEIDNGKMLNCYPEEKIWQDKMLLKAIKEF
jgi:hypothetical protein